MPVHDPEAKGPADEDVGSENTLEAGDFLTTQAVESRKTIF